MGAKTAFAAAIDGDPRVLLADAAPDLEQAAALVAEWLPGSWVPGAVTTLASGIYPGDEANALRIPGLDVIGANEVLNWIEKPPPPHVLAAVGQRRLVIHQMHSVNDSMGFGVWQSGKLVRALGMDPDNGIFIDVGEPTMAELPFWNGERTEDGDYPLPFHPLELAEELLRAELGFVLEGMPDQADVEPYDISMFSFTAAARPSPWRGLLRRG